MYLERRIQAAIHGDAEFDFSAIIGWQSLGKWDFRGESKVFLLTEMRFKRMPWSYSARTTNTQS